MIVVILVGILGLWLAGNRHPAGWGLATAAYVLWLPYALGSGQAGFSLAVIVFGLICLRNYRKGGSQLRVIAPRRRHRGAAYNRLL
jgi:hypothetical protein